MNVLNQNILDDYSSYLKNDLFRNTIQNLILEYIDNEPKLKPYIYLVVIKIKKSKREKGYGSAILLEIIKFADKYNVQIVLYATNIFGADLQRLYKFYIKHGFVLIKNSKYGKFIYKPKINKEN
jgi:GNAT superfamily N-acetyltransferase